MFLSLYDVNSSDLRSDDQTLRTVLDDLVFSLAAPAPQSWWVEEDLNLRPHAYQACALTT
jgi:hypothetical protein